MNKKILFLFLFVQSIARAQDVSTISTKVETPTSVLGSTFILKNMVTSATDTTPAANQPSTTSAIKLIPGFHAGDQVTVLTLFGFNALSDGTTQAIDGIVAARYKAIALGDYIKVSLAASGIIPMSTKSVQNDRLETEIRVAPQVQFDLAKTEAQVVRRFGGFYEPQYAHDFNDATIAPGKKPIMQQRLQQWLDVHYAANSKLTLSFDSIYNSVWTYTSPQNNFWAFDESISYWVMPNLITSLGHSSGGNSASPVGTDTSLKQQFAQNRSDFFGSLVYTW